MILQHNIITLVSPCSKNKEPYIYIDITQVMYLTALIRQNITIRMTRFNP